MKKFNEYINEGLRDKMTGISEEEALSAFMGLTPHAMKWKVEGDDFWYGHEMYNKFSKKADERLDAIGDELDDIFKSYDGKDRQVKTAELFEDVIKWVDKYGGNKENLIQYGIKSFANQIQESFAGSHSHMWEQLYSYDSVHSFHKLLKQLANDEVSLNNKEVSKFIWG